MSTKKVTTVADLAIVKKIMELLQLGEAGKIGAFFSKQIKDSEKAIRDLKRNKTTLENAYNDDVEDLTDQLQDAKEAVNDAYMAVTAEDVKTNAAMNSFADTYWYNVTQAEGKVDRIEKRMEETTDSHKEAIKDLNKQIAKYQARIDALTN
jgi:chaperonin cofactor prefoldin